MTAHCPACAAVPVGNDTALLGPKLQFSVPDVHCAACIGKIERGLLSVIGVRDVRLNLSLKRLTVAGTADAGDIQNALSRLGYQAHPLDLEALDTGRDEKGRALLLRMAVAGFAMMNIMLLSVAVWSGAEAATRDMFHLISAAIALPVVAYSGQPFFAQAWAALRVKQLNMDVPISLAILLAAGMSLFETLNGGEHAYFDAAVSLTFFLLIGRYLDHKTRSAAKSAAKELTALEVHTAELLKGDRATTVPLSKLTVGDRILVPAGARIPVDGVLETATGLLDRSLVTGESDAVAVEAGAALQTGEVNLAGPLTLRATAVGEDTSLRRMAAMVETAENARNSYTALADKTAQAYAPSVHLLALVSFLGWYVIGGDLRQALNVAAAVLIITCPCALGLAVPAVSTAAISRLFSAGYLVKHGTALERLSEVDHVLFDKTGTLTKPMVSVPQDLSAQDKAVAKALAQLSHHPVSKALSDTLATIDPVALTNAREVEGQGVQAEYDGDIVKLGRGPWVGSNAPGLALRIGDQAPVDLHTTETPRPGAEQAISQLALPAEIITGDTPKKAEAIGQQLGLPVHADLRPEQKLDLVQRYASDGRKVLMVGDGLNDTASLAAAHASIAPASALEASRAAADIVLLRDSLEDLPLVLSVAAANSRLCQQNFAIATVYNVIAVPIAVAGYATPLAAALAMSISSITVVLNAQRMRYVK